MYILYPLHPQAVSQQALKRSHCLTEADSAVTISTLVVTYRDVGLSLCAVERQLQRFVPVVEGEEPLGPEGRNEVFVLEPPVEAEHSVEVQSQTAAVGHQHAQFLPLRSRQETAVRFLLVAERLLLHVPRIYPASSASSAPAVQPMSGRHLSSQQQHRTGKLTQCRFSLWILLLSAIHLAAFPSQRGTRRICRMFLSASKLFSSLTHYAATLSLKRKLGPNLTSNLDKFNSFLLAFIPPVLWYNNRNLKGCSSFTPFVWNCCKNGIWIVSV